MTNVKDLMAGIFVLVSLLLFLVFLAWAGKIRALFEDKTEVTLLLPKSVPITTGAAVRYEGILVGEVTDIRLRSNAEKAQHPLYNVRMVLAVRSEIEITKATEAIVVADGLLGSRYVELRASPPATPPLDPGEPLLGALGGIDSFLGRIDSIAIMLNRLLDRLGTLVDPEGGTASVPALVTKFSALADQATTFVTGIERTRDELHSGVTDARTTLASLNRIVTDNEVGIRDLMRELRALPADLKSTLAEYRAIATNSRTRIGKVIDNGSSAITTLRDTVENLGQAAQQTFERFDDLVARNDRNIFLALHNLRVAAEEMKLALARVRADPSQVLFGGKEDPDTAEAAARKSAERDLLDKGFLPPRWKR